MPQTLTNDVQGQELREVYKDRVKELCREWVTDGFETGSGLDQRRQVLGFVEMLQQVIMDVLAEEIDA